MKIGRLMLGPELPVAARTASTGVQILRRLWSAVSRKRRQMALVGIFRQELGIGEVDIYNYRVAMNHPLYQVGTPHPDDLDAFASIVGVDMHLWNRATTLVSDGDISGQLSDGFFLVGSPEAEAITRLAFGYKATRVGMKHFSVGVDLPFRWEEDGSLIKAAYKKYVPGRGLVARPNWPVIDQRESSGKSIFPRVDNRGMLVSDLLLITKVPNYLTTESYQGGRSIVSVAGSHGVGTRAIELVLRNRTLMAQIGVELAKKYQGFQILLDVDRIVHNAKKGSRGRRVTVRAVAPVEFQDRVWANARREIGQRLPQWIREVSG